MKKSDSKDKNVFVGVCGKCGEIYEASSIVDNLEGVTFNCKKALCSGRVELEHSSEHPAYAAKIILSDADEPTKDPRRYC